jgi:hypothetical protein
MEKGGENRLDETLATYKTCGAASCQIYFWKNKKIIKNDTIS